MTKRVYRKKLAPNQKLASVTPEVWKLPPYVVARFGGELSQIMIEAAKEYIAEKCLAEINQSFNKEIAYERH